MTDHATAARKHDRVLRLWANGVDSRHIAQTLGVSSANEVRNIVSKARGRGDARAVVRASGRPKRHAVNGSATL